MSADKDGIHIFQNSIQRLSFYSTGKPGSIIIGAEHKENRGFGNMFLIAAQDGKVISSLSVFNGDDRNKLHIDPVRSGLHGLYDLSQVFLGNRLVLIGTDATAGSS